MGQTTLADLGRGAGDDAPCPHENTREMRTSPRHTNEAQVVTWCSGCVDVVGRRPA